MNWKGFGRKQSWPNRGTIPVFPGGTEESHERPVKHSRCPCRDRTEGLQNTSVGRYRPTRWVMIILIIALGEEDKLRSSSVCNFLHCPAVRYVKYCM
jgi:hypothetical protein